MTSAPITDSAPRSTPDRAVATPAEGAVPPPGSPPAGRVPDVVRDRLAPPMPTDRLASWLGTAAVVLIAAILRLVGLTWPKGKIFDEIYYATEGDDLIKHGVEWNSTNNTGDFVVHPPLGKWLIGLGEWLFAPGRFGLHLPGEFGWRIMPALAGIVSVLIAVRVARRLFRSTLLGCAAGLLIALDGMHLVLSRSALLDIFLMTFILAAFAALVMDRESRRRRWLWALEAGLDPTRRGLSGRPALNLAAVPWWRLLAAVLVGCAMSVKWSALWYIVLFVVLIYVWEAGARKSAGVPHYWRDTLIDETLWVLAFGAVVAIVYLASWSGWFLNDHGYDRHWIRDDQKHHEYPVISALQNLYHYHRDALYFHDHLVTKHTYQSWPWQWLLLGRPVAFYWSSAGPCGASSCASEVLLLGTPVLWWSFLPALVGLVWFAISRRDWRAWAIFLGVLAGIVPWFNYELSDRTMFYFYALPAEPFLVFAVVYVLGALMRSPARLAAVVPAARRRLDPDDRRLYGAVVAGVYLLLVALCFAYFYPLYVGRTIPYLDWFHRMWLGNRWI